MYINIKYICNLDVVNNIHALKLKGGATILVVHSQMQVIFIKSVS